jgi:biotin carboxyl carrier protein
MATARILAPLPGTFFRSPSPADPPFKSEGDTVTPGDVVGLVEVMKTFYEVTAETGGKVVRFLVGDSDAVDADQPLVELET